MKPWLVALSLSGIGFYIAGSIVICVVGGHWLDTKFGTAPLWFIVGLVLGLIVAGYGTYAMLRPFIESIRKDKDNK